MMLLSLLLTHHWSWEILILHSLLLILLTLCTKLLSIRIMDTLLESSSHGNIVGEIGGQSVVELRVGCLKMSSETSVLGWKVIVLFLVHLLVDNILLGHAERASCATFVDLGSSSSRLNASFQTSVTATRCSNVSSLLVLLVGALSLLISALLVT